jgi:hypothetical protein
MIEQVAFSEEILVETNIKTIPKTVAVGQHQPSIGNFCWALN